jgi:hypothetical protein
MARDTDIALDTIDLIASESAVRAINATDGEASDQINVPTFEVDAEPHPGKEREAWGSKLQAS